MFPVFHFKGLNIQKVLTNYQTVHPPLPSSIHLHPPPPRSIHLHPAHFNLHPTPSTSTQLSATVSTLLEPKYCTWLCNFPKFKPKHSKLSVFTKNLYSWYLGSADSESGLITCDILVLITLRELDGGWNEVDGGGWSWVEVEISWVEVGARFSNTLYLTFIHS